MAAKAALENITKKNFLLLGTCVPCLRADASKIKVKRLDMDENLLMYFKKEEFIFAFDPNKICKTGDIVLIQQLPKKLSPTLTHKVLEVIYQLGDVTDPVTGKKVVSGLYRDEWDQRIQRFGKLDTAFDYKKAPKRGWLEDKKDFSHRESYVKYNIFDDDDQPYALK